MNDLRIARLSQKDIEAIRECEKTLDRAVCLVAVEKGKALYVLEAKLGPNQWQRIDRVYPEIEGITAYFSDPEAAKTAKSSLKTFLLSGKTRSLIKRPIRIRLSVPMTDEED
ncbi:MAG: hypothetical protein PVH30_02750 [Desulfobacterales bacterium]|jgi:hypothetical protein